jgi:glycosyltransferase involved in cell wall biosynthesis
MRIGFDVAQTCVERAGCAWYADSLARALAEILTPADELILYHHFADWLNASTDHGTRIEARNVKMPLRRLSAKDAKTVWADPADRRLGRPDIVHANSYRAPRVAGARLIYTVYDVSFWTVPEFTTDENRLTCQAGTLDALARADGFIFISRSAREEFERVLPGWLEERAVPSAVIHLGARETNPMAGNRPPLQMPADEPYWLAVGTVQPRKNYEALIEALPLYRQRSGRPAPLVVAGGSGWKSEALKEKLARHEAEGAIRWLGYVDDDELNALYRNARGLLFPSWYEGFGLPVLEAMSHGCPVIASDVTSLREVGGTAARYIDPTRPETIAEAMLALETRTDLAQLRAKSLEQSRGFSWRKAAEETLAFYREVLATER